MITAVTGYVHIPDHPRSGNEYCDLGHKLSACDINLMCTNQEVEECWMFEFLQRRGKKFTYSAADNPKKNSISYHIVQAQKSHWLASAARSMPEADPLVWIDFGIFHVPGVTRPIIESFMKRAQGEQAITIPGCWEKDYVYNDAQPCWRFCGGVMVVPREHVFKFDMNMKEEYLTWMEEKNNLSWEVNTLARLERRVEGAPIWWYKANHDASLFTNYRTTEHADGTQS
jgi:hypothetical protein